MPGVVRRLHDLPGGRFARDEPVVALTFDDGPGQWTSPVVETLVRLDVPATFFVVGSVADRARRRLASITAAGHTVGGHSWSHAPGAELDDAAVVDECVRTATLIEDVTGRPAPFVRPPYRKEDGARYAQLLEPHGMLSITWSVDPRDWAETDPVVIARGVLDHLHFGAIVVLHDGGGDRSATVDALPLIVRGGRMAGYRFVAL